MTKLQIKALLLSNDRAVERAMVALLARQTADEQSSHTTRHQNGRGFSAFDAHQGTYYAKWVQSGRKLTGRHLDKARRMAVRYVGQLAEVSEMSVKQGPTAPTAYLVLGESRLCAEILAHDPFQFRHTPARDVRETLWAMGQ